MSIALVISARAAPALAHAAPQVLDVVWRPDGGLLLVTNRGLAFGGADGTGWKLMCNEAIHVTVSEKPGGVFLQDGTLLVATTTGLKATNDDGCTWRGVAPFAEVSVQAIAVHPTRPARVYVATYGMGQGGIHVTEDGGASFTTLLKVEDDDFLRSLLIAPGSPESLYAAGSVFDTTGNFQHYIARSVDSGATWERMPAAVIGDELDVTLLDVSPTNSSSLLARASGANPGFTPERLLVSRDGGKTFSSPLSIASVLSASFSADGAGAWVTGQDGLWHSSDGLQSFEHVGDTISMSYAAEHGGELWVSGYYEGYVAAKDGIARSTDAGEHFVTFTEFKDVAAQVQCDASSATAMTCQMPFIDWQRERALFGNGSSTVSVSDLDAGMARSDASTASEPAATDAASGKKGSVANTRARGCACDLGRTQRGRPHTVLLSSLLLPLFLRRRRRRHRHEWAPP
ncbi:MAG: WD40/YVTN/BNR-like repeat-containing protein [Polyangiales bacterium]